MRTFYLVLLGLFGGACGLFLGMGNHHAILGAILPGLLGGLVLSIPMVRERDRSAAILLVACVLGGSLAASFIPDSNGLKQYCRSETVLHIKAGSYELGRGSENR